jgi:hypothetical protein
MHKVPHIEYIQDFDEVSGIEVLSANPIKVKLCVPDVFVPGILKRRVDA